jgi:hypothetical protein
MQLAVKLILTLIYHREMRSNEEKFMTLEKLVIFFGLGTSFSILQKLPKRIRNVPAAASVLEKAARRGADAGDSTASGRSSFRLS